MIVHVSKRTPGRRESGPRGSPPRVGYRAGSDCQPGVVAPRDCETAHQHERDAESRPGADARVLPVEPVALDRDELGRPDLDRSRAADAGTVVRPARNRLREALVGPDVALDLGQVRSRRGRLDTADARPIVRPSGELLVLVHRLGPELERPLTLELLVLLVH